MKRLLPTLLVLLLASLACIFPISPTGTPSISDLERTVTESVQATPTASKTQTIEPTMTVPHQDVSLLPSGFLSAPDATHLLFFSPDGIQIASLATGDLGYIGSSALHVTGGTSAGIPPVVYLAWRDTQQIIQNSGGLETALVSNINLYRLAGAPGSPTLSYTTATINDTGVLTHLFIGSPDTIGVVEPVLTRSGETGALLPLSLKMENGIPVGLWFTSCMYGIGGDIVFAPCDRLEYLDLNTNTSNELLGTGLNPSQLSPDHTWVAYTGSGEGMPLSILNLVTGVTMTFPVWPENDRGSGDGVFSPDNEYVAWMEASGRRLEEIPTFHSILRVGTTAGLLIGDFADQDFDTTAGFPVMSARPVAWIDNDSVLIDVAGDDWHDNAILRLDLPATLVYLGSGQFAALTYP